MTKPRHNWWLSRIANTVIDETKEVVDDTLDRLHDAQRDVRRGLSRLIENERHNPTSASAEPEPKQTAPDTTAT